MVRKTRETSATSSGAAKPSPSGTSSILQINFSSRFIATLGALVLGLLLTPNNAEYHSILVAKKEGYGELLLTTDTETLIIARNTLTEDVSLNARDIVDNITMRDSLVFRPSDPSLVASSSVAVVTARRQDSRRRLVSIPGADYFEPSQLVLDVPVADTARGVLVILFVGGAALLTFVLIRYVSDRTTLRQVR